MRAADRRGRVGGSGSGVGRRKDGGEAKRAQGDMKVRALVCGQPPTPLGTRQARPRFLTLARSLFLALGPAARFA